MANNNAIYNAIIQGAGGAFTQRWITNSNAASYSQFKTDVEGVASTVDGLIAATTISGEQAKLMQTIAQGVFSGRYPQGQSTWAGIAAAIVALYTSLSTSLLPVDSGASISPTQNVRYYDATVSDGDGSIAAPYDTLAAFWTEVSDVGNWTLVLPNGTITVDQNLPGNQLDNQKISLIGQGKNNTILGAMTFSQSLGDTGGSVIYYQNLTVGDLTISGSGVFNVNIDNCNVGDISQSGTYTGSISLTNCFVDGNINFTGFLTMKDTTVAGNTINCSGGDFANCNLAPGTAVEISNGALKMCDVNCASALSVSGDSGATLVVDEFSWSCIATLDSDDITVTRRFFPINRANRIGPASTTIGPTAVQDIEFDLVITDAVPDSAGGWAIAAFDEGSPGAADNCVIQSAYIDDDRQLHVVVKNVSATVTNDLQLPTVDVLYLQAAIK